MDDALRLCQRTVCLCVRACVCVFGGKKKGKKKVKCTANPFSKLLVGALCLVGNSGCRGPNGDNLTSL